MLWASLRPGAGRLDVLINNAGIAGGRKAVAEVTAADIATDLNGHRGTQAVEQGAEPIVAATLIGPGGPVPW